MLLWNYKATTTRSLLWDRNITSWTQWNYTGTSTAITCETNATILLREIFFFKLSEIYLLHVINNKKEMFFFVCGRCHKLTVICMKSSMWRIKMENFCSLWSRVEWNGWWWWVIKHKIEIFMHHFFMLCQIYLSFQLTSLSFSFMTIKKSTNIRRDIFITTHILTHRKNLFQHQQNLERFL